MSARLEICKTIVDHSWIVIAPRFGWPHYESVTEPPEETKVGDGDLGVGLSDLAGQTRPFPRHFRA